MPILKLPKSSEVNKFIAKTKFFDRANIGANLKQDFTDKIQKITWKYKLSEKTIQINSTEAIKEIQVFEIELREREIPKNVLSLIDRLIKYPILYILKYKEEFVYGIFLKEKEKYYFSDWNEEIDFDFNVNNFDKLFQNLIRPFIKVVEESSDFEELVDKDIKINELKKETEAIQNKMKKEKQFNRKVELNQLLRQKRKELEHILNLTKSI